MDVLFLAHEGGWDEAAMVLVPLLFLAMLLRVAHVRASRLDDVEPDGASTPESSDASDS